MKLGMYLALGLVALVGGRESQACSYVVNETAMVAELQKVAMASIGDPEVNSISVSDFSYFESKPTPMCPDEMTYQAVIVAHYRRVGSQVCSVKLNVKKVESWKGLDEDTYTVTGRNGARCVFKAESGVSPN